MSKYEAALMLTALDRLEKAMELKGPISVDLFREVLKEHQRSPQCLHFCNGTGEHFLSAHAQSDESTHRQIERLIANGKLHCDECRGQ